MTGSEQIVYISCVDEVRYSFVSHLSEALCRKGINKLFIDSDDLLSEKAREKVEIARVAVLILPGNRMVSLDKLDKVLECQKKKDQVVVPVLYGVSTSEAEWLRALDSKGLSSVHQSRKECSDSKLVKEIVRDVYEKLFYMERIGIYSKLLEIEKMVCKQPLGIRRVGIWGMPGIGKTTLAKAVFDQISSEFDACCFIEDYEKVFHENGLYRLLGEQLLRENPGAGGTIAKLSLLREKLINKRVLFVLDDVCNPLAAESFLGGFNWFGPGSLIIITSRDKQVFRLCGVSQIYEVQGLNEKEALQLFFLYASIKDMAEQNLLELSVKVVKYVNGNPLALNIFGKELKGKKKLSEMETAFVKLKRRPPCKIVDAFKSSYDTLSDSEKNIFLDIACFFQGENVDYVMQLLEGCGFFPHVGIDVLVEKCLVTVSENRVQMQNLIQDVGREIINGETVQIMRRSRLWEPWSIKYLLEDDEHKANVKPKTTIKRAQGAEEIEGMFLDTSNLSFDIKPAAFDSMLNLRLLKIYCSNPELHPVINFAKGSLRSLPNELRLLHWENYPLQSLPQSFNPTHLVEINMPYSQLRKLWGGAKSLEMLRTIRLCHSRQLVNVDDLLKAQNLEVIDLQGCTGLQSFPATGQLLHLRVVNLSGCTQIKSFAEIPPNIETLHLQGTGIIDLSLSIVKPNFRELKNLLKEIPGLSGVSNLEQSDLEPLTSRIKMSTSNQYPGKLVCLELKDCSRLQSLPNMVSLEFLNVLNLSGCLGLETIHGFPRNLKELYLAGTAVREVPKLPQSLEVLNAHGCISLKSIHLDFQQLPMHYTFSNCFDLSPQVVKDFLVKALANLKHMPKDLHQELNKTLAFSFCAPSHVNDNSILDLQPGSSVMMQLDPSWRSTFVGFTMLAEVSFSKDYYDATGFGISCVCRWKNKEGHFNRLERTIHYWAPGEAIPKVEKDHIFVFSDVKLFGETNNPDIFADLVVFEFFPVNKEKKRLDCTVTKCGLNVIASATQNTSLKMMSSPDSSLDPMELSGNNVEEELRVSYSGLQEIDKALFLYIACLFNNEDVDLVAPLITSIDLDISSGLKVLANSSLIHVSSNGHIVMHSLLRNMGKEILRESILPGHSKDLTQDFEKVSMASSLSCNWTHDVFTSFNGKDVHENFVSHLLQAFKIKGILTFIEDELGRGLQISLRLVQAIRQSKISIVVFSKDYASSSWNLNELVEIANCKQELDQKVIPIFYDVDPSDVREQTGEFGSRFEQTCKNKTEDEKLQWCHALTRVANIPGYFSENWHNEEDTMETIATDVLRSLNSTASKEYDDYLIGIEDHISKMNSLLCLESEVVKMVGIWGPLGIGKSTIARVLYSQLARQFRRSIFVKRSYVENRMDNSRRDKLNDYDTKLCLQTQFLSRILGQKCVKVDHVGMVKERLKDLKVLIVLDHVDDKVLLDALVGQTQWFGSGSRIIVITQDKGLLKSHGIDNIYKVDLPSKKQALQMFCQFVFRQTYPSNGFAELAVEFAETVGNLPLGLRVLGSSLRGRDKTHWMVMLPQIRERLDRQMEEILRVAYDRLNDHDKFLFLHIACLFNYDTVEYVTRLLADCDFNVVLGLTSLAEKSLIHITEQRNITMSLLQQINVGQRNRLEGVLDTKSVIGISLDICEIDEAIIFGKRGFSRMKNLRFLKFYTNAENKEVKKEIKVHLTHEFEFLCPKLRLLHWEAFPMKCMPPNFHLTNLVELTMKSSKLEKLWDGAQPLGSLKCMSLRGSQSLKEFPDLSYATILEKLDLGGCMSLVELPSSIGSLHELRDLDMEGCIKLEVLPTSINLKSLNCLNLKGCSQLRSFPDISRNMSVLYLDGTAIEEIPLWIENMSWLSSLSMNGCNKLKKISPNIAKLKFLVEVDFSNCRALPKDSWQLRKRPVLLSE